MRIKKEKNWFTNQVISFYCRVEKDKNLLNESGSNRRIRAKAQLYNGTRPASTQKGQQRSSCNKYRKLSPQNMNIKSRH